MFKNFYKKQFDLCLKLKGKTNTPILFFWEKNLWKTDFAKEFAKIFFWENEEISRKIDNNTFLDCIFVDWLWFDWKKDENFWNFDQEHRKILKAKTEAILISDIKKIIEIANKSSISWKKIIIIRDIERMNEKSFNAFLKTLEESPANTFFLCTSSNIWFLAETIKSRFLKIEFQNLSKNKTFEFLKEKNIEESKFQDIFDLSLWKLKIIEKFLDNPDFFENKKSEIEEIEEFLEKNSNVEKINRALKLATDKELIENEIENFFIIVSKKKWNYINIFENLLILKSDIFSNINKKLALENFYFNSF